MGWALNGELDVDAKAWRVLRGLDQQFWTKGGGRGCEGPGAVLRGADL